MGAAKFQTVNATKLRCCHKTEIKNGHYYLNVRLVLTFLQAARGKGRGGSKNKKTALTEEQKQEIREAFDLFDTDGSGMLSIFELTGQLIFQNIRYD